MGGSGSKAVLVVVVGYVLTTLVAIVTNVATEVLPERWIPHLWIAWPVLGVLVLGGALLVRSQHRSSIESRQPVTAERALFSRRAMLSYVRTHWVNGVLEQSLYRRTIAELGLQERPDLLRRPWDLVLEEQDQLPRPLDQGVTLANVLERHRGLLVLGGPGAGKTTMLLTLLEELMDDAARDDTAPIPVVFPLSTWTSNGSMALEKWFVDELCGPLYGLPRDLAEQWVADERVLPLLDGLDEVASGNRRACALAIDAFQAAHRLLPLVVTSRAADYEALNLHLSLGSALFIQPLSRIQTEDYLDRLGESMTGLRKALHEEPSLWGLLQTPFLLNVAVRAYGGRPVEDIGTGDSLQQQRRIIAAYVDRAVRRKRARRQYRPDDSVRWLGFIARALGRQLEPFFVVEMADISWLSPPRQSLVALLTAIPGGVLAGGAIGMLMGLFFNSVTGIVSGVFIGIAFIIPLAMFGDGPAVKHVSFSDRSKFPSNRRNTLIDDIGRLVMFGVVLAPMLAMLGLVLGVVFGAVVSLIANASFFDTSLRGASVGLILGAMSSVLILIALPPPQSDKQNLRHRPSGSGLRDAIWFALVPSAIVGAQVSSTLTDAYGNVGLLTGVVLACAIGYLYAGRGLLGHWLSHLLLIRAGGTPKRLSSFLDFAVEQTLMLKVGAGYVFAHRLLLEYFADLKPANAAGASLHVFLPALDLRPEVLLAQALDDVKATPGGIVRTLEHVGSALPPEVWVPAATRIAATLRAMTPTEPTSPLLSDITRYIRQVKSLVDILWLIAEANHGALSAAAAVEFGELVWMREPKLLSLVSRRNFDEMTEVLRSIAVGSDPDLAKRARAVVHQIAQYGHDK